MTQKPDKAVRRLSKFRTDLIDFPSDQLTLARLRKKNLESFQVSPEDSFHFSDTWANEYLCDAITRELQYAIMVATGDGSESESNSRDRVKESLCNAYKSIGISDSLEESEILVAKIEKQVREQVQALGSRAISR